MKTHRILPVDLELLQLQIADCKTELFIMTLHTEPSMDKSDSRMNDFFLNILCLH